MKTIKPIIMKPISARPIYIKRNNNKEKNVAIIFLALFTLLLLVVSITKGATNNGSVKRGTTAHVENENNNAIVSWNIAADGRYRFFIIERTRDKVHYEFVSMVKNSGANNVNTFYAITDHNPLDGTTYYRISATDLQNQPVRLFEVPFSATGIN